MSRTFRELLLELLPHAIAGQRRRYVRRNGGMTRTATAFSARDFSLAAHEFRLAELNDGIAARTFASAETDAAFTAANRGLATANY
ncbi:MAG TPA: hypothetical protein VF618_24935 [Thermoanaerobaculia bacterium]